MTQLILTATNFGSIKELSVDLSNRGLVLIVGENKDSNKADSNGSGKSLMLDAFCWAVWGQTVRGIKGDSVVNKKQKKNCVVKVELGEYTIIRHQADKNHIKTNDLELFFNDKNITSNSISETQKIINDIVGLDFTTFCAMQPGAGIKLAELTDKHIKELLEKLLQTESLSNAQKIAIAKSKELDAEINTLIREKIHVDENVSHHILMVDEYNRKNDSFLQDTANSLTSANDVLNDLLSKLVEDENELVKAKNKEQENSDIDLEISNIETLISSLTEKMNDISSNYDKKASSVYKIKVEEETKLKVLKAKLSRFKNVEAVCSHCNQVVTDEYKQSELNNLNLSISRAENNIKNVELTIKDLQEEKEKQLNNIKPSISDFALKKKNLQNSKHPIAPMSFYQSNIDRSKKSYEDQQRRIEEIQSLQSPFDSLIESGSKKIEELKLKSESIDSKISNLTSKKEKYDFWVDGFSPKGIRSLMLRNITPFLNERADYYSKIITDGEMRIVFETEKTLKNGSTKEDFNILLEMENGASVYAGCSGGEKARADLIISLALGDLASLRSSKKLPFRFIDEAFEKVDDSGLDAIVKLLHQQTSQYESIFVVTHKTELKQYFDKVITVTKKSGYTSVEESI